MRARRPSYRSPRRQHRDCSAAAASLEQLEGRRNAPPGYTKRDLDQVDAKALELIAVVKEHWEPYQKSGFKTIKARSN
jgi:hypothetical protein